MQASLALEGLPPIPTTIRLEIHGSIPSYKNNKLIITKSPSGKPLKRALIITKPEFQARMEQIISSIVSQLLSASQTAGGQTSVASSIRSLIASCVPADDCWTKLPEIHVKGELCAEGSEGASILIERL